VSDEVEPLFPGLASDGDTISSPESAAYNCVAWAVGEMERWWPPGFYRPVAPGDVLAALVALFVPLGYRLNAVLPCPLFVPASETHRPFSVVP
jgi:hypothetical protein